MREDALTALLAQARRSVPSVRAAALLRIARVQSVSDLEVALRTFDEGLATVTAPLERFQRLFESGSSIGRGNAFQELEELRSEGSWTTTGTCCTSPAPSQQPLLRIESI